MFFIVTFLILLFSLSVDVAFAWGPLTHVRFGLEALQYLPLFAPAVQEFVRLHPLDFLYGNLSADLIIAKDMVRESEKHCHRWEIGFEVLQVAKTPAQKAFAYGYLTHLAADTISHNFFVPELSVTHFKARRLQHSYWELRFDHAVARDLWDPTFQIAKRCRHHDALLAAVLQKTLFSFRTNGRIFHGVLWAQRLKRWRKTTAWIDRRSRWAVSSGAVDRYFTLAMDSVLGFLADPHRAYCRRLDPTGHPILDSAKTIRIILQELEREKKLTHTVLEKVRSGLQLSLPPAGLYSREKEKITN
ncbi:MAG: zinc dependent phospholipase C family protein [Deltaproteobacteria bacterium]|nr:zinc dependent phospholipase C family protein [Deltaproteobacteria bacterium]